MAMKSFISSKRKQVKSTSVLVAHPSADLYGSDRVLLESIKALVDTGASVVVTLPANGPLVPKITEVGAVVELCATPVLRKAMMKPKGFLQLVVTSVPSLLRSAQILRSTGAGTVYVNTQTIPLWLLVSRLMGRKVVLHVHEAEGNAASVVRLALAAPAIFAHKIISNSNFSTGVLTRALPLLEGRTEVIYNGVPGPGSDLRAPRENLQDGVRLVYMGRLSQRKGIDVAISALSLLLKSGIQAHLNVVGAIYPGNESFEVTLRGQAAALGVESSITWNGFTPSVWPLVAESDIVLVPSRLDEPFGNTAVEAVLAQRPVVVSETSGLKEAAAGYSSVAFVTPGDAQALADAVTTIVGDWHQWRDAAIKESSTAQERHAPSLYRERVAQAVLNRSTIAMNAGSGNVEQEAREN